MANKQNVNNDVTFLVKRIEKLEKEHAQHSRSFAIQAHVHEQRIKALECILDALKVAYTGEVPKAVNKNDSAHTTVSASQRSAKRPRDGRKRP